MSLFCVAYLELRIPWWRRTLTSLPFPPAVLNVHSCEDGMTLACVRYVVCCLVHGLSHAPTHVRTGECSRYDIIGDPGLHLRCPSVEWIILTSTPFPSAGEDAMTFACFRYVICSWPICGLSHAPSYVCAGGCSWHHG